MTKEEILERIAREIPRPDLGEGIVESSGVDPNKLAELLAEIINKQD